MISFAKLLRQFRAAAGLTQEELAERAELSTRAISDLERGVKQRPYPNTVRRLARALRLTEEEVSRLQQAARDPSEATDGSAILPKAVRLDLPIQPTPFVGRQVDVEQLTALVAQEGARLLTLTGPGGVGKTRLALRVAEEVAANFPDGVVFVTLASLAESSLVPAAIAGALGIVEGSGQPIVERLIAYLRDKRLLLILDTFEHLLPAGDAISRLLAACPDLVIMVTSQAILHLAAERGYPVRSMPVPVPGHLPDLDALARYDAVQLFLQRAEAVKPGFRLTEENASVIAEICRRLDGLPLAIELAVARLRLFPSHALLAQLSGRLQLLTGGARDLPARQQTLRNTIDWSCSLLGPEEQTLFSRLSVFSGGCTFEAAEAICNPEGELDLLEALSGLVDKSLVLQREVADEPRFLMLDTIREYAAEKLEASGQAASIRNRHADFFANLVEQTSPPWVGPDLAAWLDRLEADHDNLRAALRWLLDSGSAT